jgi:ligand-binding sensor domain-containing protein/signal transduction histidine kinase
MLIPSFFWARALLLLLFLGGSSALALDPGKKITQFGHEVWQQEQGLPQNTILAIAQTPDGYLWFGTDEGLVRFDGLDFTIFNKLNTREFLGDNIHALLVDRQGALWIGMAGGVLYRRVKDRFEVFTAKEGLAGATVNCMAEDRDGSLWIGTNGGLSHFVNGAFHTYGTKDGLSNARIMSLLQDHTGRLWVGTARGLNIFEAGRFQPGAGAELADDLVAALCEDAQGSLWIGTTVGGLWQLKDGNLRRIGPKPGPQPLGFRALALDRQGNLWIASRSSGLLRYRDGQFETYSRAQGLSGETVLSLFEDREGSLWIGMFGTGLNRLRDKAFVSYSEAEGLPPGLSTAVMEGRDGSMWVGSAGTGGLSRMTDGKVTHLGHKDGLSSNVIYSLTEGQDGSVWVGTGSGLDRLKAGKVQSYSKKQGLLGEAVACLVSGKDGALWIGTLQGGLNLLKDGRISSFSRDQGLPNDSVLCLLESRDGGLWIGTSGGLARLQNGRITTPVTNQDLSGSAVYCLLEEGDGTLWIGTEGAGLRRLKNGKLASVTTKEGLFHDKLFALLDDGLGHFWMTCNKGVFRVDKKELDDVADRTLPALHCVSYGVPDGMRSAECLGGIQPSGWRSRDGRLWFPTTRGLAVVNPANLVQNLLPPPTHIERVLITREKSGHPMTEQAKVEGSTGLINVSAGATGVEIHYTALSFLVPERVRFEYRLEGFDPDWVQAGARRTAYYTNLPPGTFRFHVRACNNDGVWNLDGASAPFKVHPRYYQTYWFYGLCGLLAISLGALIQRHFEQVRIHQLELKNRVLDERNRLGRDVHDQLSQTMTGLLLQLEAGGHALRLGADQCRPYLDRAVELAREGLAETRRTIRGFRATALEDGNLAQALDGIAQRLTTGTDVTVEVRQEGPPRSLPKRMEDTLFRAGQEGITNALRHGQAHRIELRLAWEGKGVRLVVSDNGRGMNMPFDPSVPSVGLGLSGMFERITDNKGTLQVSAGPAGGTILEVFLPRSAEEA